MSAQSVNLLRERVIRAAIECVAELEQVSVMHTKGSRALVRAVKALQQETWRADEAPRLIENLTLLIEKCTPEGALRSTDRETLLRAKAFIGQRAVTDDTTPKPPAIKRKRK